MLDLEEVAGLMTSLSPSLTSTSCPLTALPIHPCLHSRSSENFFHTTWKNLFQTSCILPKSEGFQTTCPWAVIHSKAHALYTSHTLGLQFGVRLCLCCHYFPAFLTWAVSVKLCPGVPDTTSGWRGWGVTGRWQEGLHPPRGQEEPTWIPIAATVFPGKNDSIWIKLAIQLQLSFLSEGC